jgi:hypothetical protein
VDAPPNRQTEWTALSLVMTARMGRQPGATKRPTEPAVGLLDAGLLEQFRSERCRGLSGGRQKGGHGLSHHLRPVPQRRWIFATMSVSSVFGISFAETTRPVAS